MIIEDFIIFYEDINEPNRTIESFASKYEENMHINYESHVVLWPFDESNSTKTPYNIVKPIFLSKILHVDISRSTMHANTKFTHTIYQTLIDSYVQKRIK